MEMLVSSGGLIKRAGSLVPDVHEYVDMLTDHPVLVAGGGAIAGGLGGVGAHALASRIALAPSKGAIARHHEAIGKMYEAANRHGGDVHGMVEADLARSGTRKKLEKAVARNQKLVKFMGKLRSPIAALGALAGGALAYNQFFG